MRKTVVVLLLTLIIVYVVLLIATSNDQEYIAERAFYRAMKTGEKIAVNPDVAPPAMVASVEAGLQEIIGKYSKTNIAVEARIRLAEFYTAIKKYDKALAAANNAIASYPKDKLTGSRAQLIKGAVYEKQNNWNKALQEYTILRDRYRDTPLGMQTPIHIARHYQEKGGADETKKAFDDAILFYDKIGRENKATQMGYIALSMKTQCYLLQKEYDKAGSQIEEIINNYPFPAVFAQQLPSVEIIFVKILKQPQRAIAIYNFVIGKTSDGKLKDFFCGRKLRIWKSRENPLIIKKVS